MTRLKFIRSHLLAGPPKPSHALALGLLFVAIPTLVRWGADPVITGTAFVTYYPFVLMAAILRRATRRVIGAGQRVGSDA